MRPTKYPLYSPSSTAAWEGYLRVNAAVAQKLLPLLADDDMVWVHDYHQN
jgi:trehalose-6-phosphate synthase